MLTCRKIDLTTTRKNFDIILSEDIVVNLLVPESNIIAHVHSGINGSNCKIYADEFKLHIICFALSFFPNLLQDISRHIK